MKLIVNASKNWAIGSQGDLLFKLPDDMKFFRENTKNKVVVMGRKTLMSLPGGRPLKNRINIVLTTDESFHSQGCTICNSYEILFNELKKYNPEDIYLIGGGKLYNDLYPYCSEAVITKVDAVKEADTYLHNFDEDKSWKHVFKSEEHINDGIRFTFNKYINVNEIKKSLN